MSYSYHCALAEKEITSRNFCNLVDAAVMLYEEEEERDKRIFRLFPRKTRFSVKKLVTRRNPQQNPNLASTSSPRNPLHESLLLDLNTIPADDSGTKIRQNPNGASSSSPFLGDYEKMTEMRNPNSQSSLSSGLTEKSSRKRRAPQGSGKSKKLKVETFSWKGRETPKWLIKLMEDMDGTDLRLIFERNLFKTDVNPSESRLSMPFNELIRKDFLTPEESRIVEEDINNDKKTGVGAILVDQRKVKWGVMLKRWEMKKDSGRGSWNYALTCGWNDVVKANGLRQGNDVSV